MSVAAAFSGVWLLDKAFVALLDELGVVVTSHARGIQTGHLLETETIRSSQDRSVVSVWSFVNLPLQSGKGGDQDLSPGSIKLFQSPACLWSVG